MAATTLTAQMIGSLGMDGTLFSYEAMQIPSAANVVARVASTDEGKARIEDRLAAARLRARAMLTENRHVVEALRDALLECHELIGDEIIDVIHDAVARSGSQAAAEPRLNRRYGF
jgi:ATP-dependent Zn protease